MYHIILWLTLLIIVSLLQGVGCTLIGFSVGAIQDNRSDNRPSHYVTIPYAQIHSLSPGTGIALASTDGSWISGAYAGPAAENYSALYTMNRMRLPGQVSLPALGDTVTIVVTSGEQVEGQFVGFANRSTLILRPLESPGSSRLAIDQVRTMVNRQGIATDGVTLGRVMAFGEPPLPVVVVLHEGVRSVVAMDSITQVFVPVFAPRHGKRNGFLFGLVLDLILSLQDGKLL